MVLASTAAARGDDLLVEELLPAGIATEAKIEINDTVVISPGIVYMQAMEGAVPDLHRHTSDHWTFIAPVILGVDPYPQRPYHPLLAQIPEACRQPIEEPLLVVRREPLRRSLLRLQACLPHLHENVGIIRDGHLPDQDRLLEQERGNQT